eukprot:CAMPEP_0196582390 /NCGR_PEP_ID=MMETSP1081-20130531/38734_1 /TAXON_ID=36882 /ORGANISM="Pyramimonas amylifera, Strain CCMP720" /LENGTH=571 /DNA_ID=CAMNT_0041902939 /DNA_START=202 /DNA_END=1917 /DNA_ORIENTATION=+
MAPLTVYVKPSTSARIDLQVEGENSVGWVKTQVEQRVAIPPDQQRLIYKGRVLKDEQTITSIGIQEGHTIYLVKGGAAPSASAPNSSSSPPMFQAANQAPPGQAPGQQAQPGLGGAQGVHGSDPFGLGGMAGLGDMGGMMGGMGGFGQGTGAGMPSFQQFQQQMMENPNMMQEMLNSPAIQGMVQNFTANPDMLRGIMESNPAFQELLASNPELSHVMNDPAILRQSLEVARNPELMREQMRNTDRALTNIESHPEGFNMLRRMYQNVQEPLMSAATTQAAQRGAPASAAQGGTTDNPFASLFGPSAATGTTGAPNASPLPNPWAPAPQAQAAAPPTNPLAGSPFAGLFPSPPPPSSTAPGPNTYPTANLFNLFNPPGGTPASTTPPAGTAPPTGTAPPAGTTPPTDFNPMDPASLGIDMNQMMSLMQQPAMQQMVQSVLSDPQRMQQMLQQAQANPLTRSMMDANPHMREMMQNPEALRQMMGSGEQGMLSQLAGLNNLAGLNLNAGFDPLHTRPTTHTPGASVQPPEAMYAAQLQQLQDMGFVDQPKNIQALVATAGNINAAIERLLSQ